MSIIIPGMKMPTACIYCPFMVSRDGDDCILQSNEANASFLNWEQMKAGCPLVELPSHGRLIDADANIKVLNACIEKPENDIARECYKYAKTLLNACPSIIQAASEGGVDG